MKLYHVAPAGNHINPDRIRSAGKQRKRDRKLARTADARAEQARQQLAQDRERWAETDRLNACQNGTGTGEL